MVEFAAGDRCEALLAPLPTEQPSAMDLANAKARLREARGAARAAERRADAGGEEESGNREADRHWALIAELAPPFLQTRSKDLEVAAWFTEALLRLEGLAGLTLGFRLMHGLVERFWDELHPMPDEDGLATRVAPIGGLNGQSGDGTLIQPLRKIALFEREDGGDFAIWQYEMASQIAAGGDAAQQQRAAEQGLLTPDAIAAAVTRAGTARFIALREAARAALEAWQALRASLEARAGREAPSTRRVAETLTLIGDIARRFAPEAGQAEPVGGPPAAPGGEEGAPVAPRRDAPGSATGAIASREQALRQIADVARWFRETEPQSPMSYALEDAVRRGRLSWPELLAEAVEDPDARKAILLRLGIMPRADEEGG